MGPPPPVVLLALWILGCLCLLLWLWALCTACHRKQVQSQQARLQDTAMLAEMSLRRQPPLSQSDTRLHELHRGTCGGRALRPASMDLLHPHWLEASRGITRAQAAPSAFPPQQLPGAPSATAIALSLGPEATYSNVGLAAIPRAGLAASPAVWTGTRLTTGCDRPGPRARPAPAEYTSIRKPQGTGPGPQEANRGKAEVDTLYSRVCKPKDRDPGPTTELQDLEGAGALLALERDVAYEPLPLGGLHKDGSTLENVYESIRDVGSPERPEACPLRLSV